MPVRIVQSKHNARLKELRKAFERPGRDGLVAIEGPHLVEEAVRAGLRIDCLFVGGDGPGVKFQSHENIADIDVVLVPADALKSVLDTESPQLVAALVEPPDWTWAHLLGSDKGATPLIVLLAGFRTPAIWARL